MAPYMDPNHKLMKSAVSDFNYLLQNNLDPQLKREFFEKNYGFLVHTPDKLREQFKDHDKYELKYERHTTAP